MYGRGQALRAPGCSGSQNFYTIGIWSWQGCQPYAPVAFTSRGYPWYLFVKEAESTPGPLWGPERLRHWKIPMTPSKIEPTTFRIEAQSLNLLSQKGKDGAHKTPCGALLWRRQRISGFHKRGLLSDNLWNSQSPPPTPPKKKTSTI
jgi:hypothetical protein